ncbi:MAG: ABC transporter permease subunit [Chloroflexi bacterium]|nr:ABC transporter permease subunit [Chloroflexota bacterium]
MTTRTPTAPVDPAAQLSRWRASRPSFDWVGLLPFFAFIAVFLIFPSLAIVVRSVTDETGALTLNNLTGLLNPTIALAYRSSLLVSLLTALSGGLIGGLLAWAVTLGGLPHWARSSVLSFSGVAANFAGIPLVFAFTALLGRLGFLNQFLRPIGAALDPQIYLFSFTGLCIVYTYFQIPLMVLIMTPALEGLRREWREAAENLGATQTQYWRYVALPILAPAILGSMALLFANAFSAYATAQALLGAMGQNFAVTIVVSNQFRTDTFGDLGLGYSLAFSMMVVIAVTVMMYTYSRRRAERWLRRTE